MTTRERPAVHLGLLGFGEDDHARLGAWLAADQGSATWLPSAPRLADAWIIDGARARLAPGGLLAVRSDTPQEGELVLDVAASPRGLVIAAPTPAGLQARTFHRDSRASFTGALRQIDIQLTPLRAMFVLGQAVVRNGPALRHGVFHLFEPDKNELLAVLDFRNGRAGLAPDLHPEQAAGARWEKRPAGAADIPKGFRSVTTAQLSWTYAWRSQADLLPPRYRRERIHYRGAPRVPVDWLTDSQLALLRELALQPAELGVLCLRTGLALQQASRDLACLYFASAITSSAAKASHAGAAASSKADLSSTAADALPLPEAGQGPTVPASLTGRIGE